MNHCHNPAGALWFCFRDSLVDSLSRVDKQRLIDAWDSQKARTSFYRDYVLKKVAENLNLVVASELFKVDFVMAAQSSSGLQIPVVFIESENIATSTSHEVRFRTGTITEIRKYIPIFERRGFALTQPGDERSTSAFKIPICY